MDLDRLGLHFQIPRPWRDAFWPKVRTADTHSPTVPYAQGTTCSLSLARSQLLLKLNTNAIKPWLEKPFISDLFFKSIKLLYHTSHFISHSASYVLIPHNILIKWYIGAIGRKAKWFGCHQSCHTVQPQGLMKPSANYPLAPCLKFTNLLHQVQAEGWGKGMMG